DRKWPAGSISSTQVVSSAILKLAEIEDLERSNVRLNRLHALRKDHFVRILIHELKLARLQAAGDGSLGGSGLVTRMTEGNFAGRDVPALVLVGLDFLQLQLVDIEGGDISRAGLVALHHISHLDGCDFVSRQVGDFPD